jgi:triphosphatase
MFETELKFQIPSASLAGVQQALAAVEAGRVRLRARYFDTPGRHLARAAMALRLRLEGDRWVQTLKGRGDGMLQRLEHEVVLDGIAASDLPALDLSRHDGTPAGLALRRALGDQADALACRYETDVSRTLGHVVTAAPAGSTVELALDLGEIRAGSAVWPLQELEFELKTGPVDGLLALAAAWAGPHGLWLDVRSKAERGERLASGIVVGPAHADEPGTPAAVLAGVLANLSDRADPRAVGQDLRAHHQQARAGLARLRADLGDETGLAESLANSEAESLAKSLATCIDRLDAPGQPAPTEADALAAWLRGPEVQRLWLDLIGLTLRPR